MKRLSTFIIVSIIVFAGTTNAQCTFEDLFPLKWSQSAYEVNEQFQSDKRFKTSHDTIRSSAFKHHQDYFRTVRNMNLSFYAYASAENHDCFKSGDVTLICIANDSGLYAYSYMVNYPIEEKETYHSVIDSLKKMMNNKFTYSSNIKNKLQAGALAGDGVSVYFDQQPIISTNLTYAPMAIRVGYLAKQPDSMGGNGIPNSAEEIQYYRIEILYKKQMPKW